MPRAFRLPDIFFFFFLVYWKALSFGLFWMEKMKEAVLQKIARVDSVNKKRYTDNKRIQGNLALIKTGSLCKSSLYLVPTPPLPHTCIPTPLWRGGWEGWSFTVTGMDPYVLCAGGMRRSGLSSSRRGLRYWQEIELAHHRVVRPFGDMKGGGEILVNMTLLLFVGGDLTRERYCI